jgi:hypothetical protein
MKGPMQPARYRQALALLLTAPAVFAALTILSLEAWRIYRPEAGLFATPLAYSLADAIERDDVRRAYAFIRAGQDPNELIAVRHPDLTAGRGVLVSPLVWSVATNRRNATLMLLGHGARMERPADRAAACLAEALGHVEVARILRQYGPAPDPCPKSSGTGASLLSFLFAIDQDQRSRTAGAEGQLSGGPS